MAEVSILLKATLVLALALLATHGLRAARASVRALLLSSAFAVLLVLPVATLVMPERRVEVPAAYTSMPMDLLPEIPRWDEATVVTAPVEPAARRRFTMPDTSTVIRTAWAVGTIVFAVPIAIGLFRLSRMRRRGLPWLEGRALVDDAAAQAGVGRRVDLFLHEDLAAPMTCGAIRPSIGLPVDASTWSEAELRQALVHELEHVRRRDWVVHLIARTVCALYWFHPLVWIAWRDLCLESERACDDAVLRCAERTEYAEQLVSLARRVSARPAPLLSMASRSDLSTRVRDVLDATRARGRAGTACSLAIIALAGALTAAISPVRAVTHTARDDTGLSAQVEGPRPAFDVASIRHNTSGSGSMSMGWQPDGFTAVNSPLLLLIQTAHGFRDSQLIGVPEWAASERFDVLAKTTAEVTEDERIAMLQALLSDRFGLVAHKEFREVPVYALLVAGSNGRLGTGLRRSSIDCSPEARAARKPVAGAGGPGQGLPQRPECGSFTSGSTLVAGGISLAQLASSLTRRVDRIVVDRTGLAGLFDVDLKWTTMTPAASTGAAPVLEDAPSIFTAVQEQLGLRLERQRGPVEVLVIDRVERPTPNDAPNAQRAAQPQAQAAPGPAFDVVSIRRNATNALGNTSNVRPDGGFTETNITVRTLISRAYSSDGPIDIVGLPDWATSERYDVSATSTLMRATSSDRIAMLRAMLAERFNLAVHFETRAQPVFDLVVARTDGQLGPAIRTSEIDCVAKAAADRAAAEAALAAGTVTSSPELDRLAFQAVPPPRPDFNEPPPPCTVRMTGPRMEGDMTIDRLALFLRPAAGRPVIDKTGLAGSYRLTLEYDRMAGLRGPAVAPAPDAPPTVFVAVQEQLGLRLESSRADREILVIDRLERPTEN